MGKQILVFRRPFIGFPYKFHKIPCEFTMQNMVLLRITARGQWSFIYRSHKLNLKPNTWPLSLLSSGHLLCLIVNHSSLQAFWQKLACIHVSLAEIKVHRNVPYAQKVYVVHQFVYIPVSEHFFLFQDYPSIWQVWHLKILIKQHYHCTGAPCAGDNKRPL